MREKLARTPGVAVVGEELVGRPGVAGWDPLRLVLDVRATGCTGYEVAEALRRSYDVQPELATHATLVFVLGMGQPVPDLERLAGDLDETVKRMIAPGPRRGARAPHRRARATRWPSRRARRSSAAAERVPVDDAVGRVSCESIAGYPPGIPALLPGERITRRGRRLPARAGRRRRAAARRERPDLHHPDRPGRRGGPPHMSTDTVLYTARAHNTGGRDGRAVADDGYPDLVVKPPKALGGPDVEATNPEELFALGYGACYLSALSLVARSQKISAKEFEIASRVDLVQDGDRGFKIAVELSGTLPGVDDEQAAELMRTGAQGLPVLEGDARQHRGPAARGGHPGVTDQPRPMVAR